jgi:predicted Zn-dependent protease
MKRVRSALAVAVAFVAICGCITDPVTGESVMGMPTSDAEEEQMGEQYRPVILQQFSGAYPDAELQSYLGGIVLGMAKSSARPELQWTFTVLNDSQVNAFAVPGGEVFMTRGLLWRLDDEAEFAVVMGHEIGHVEHRHTVQAMGRDTLIGTLGQLGGEALGSREIGNLASGLITMRFSRDQERESDVRGVHNSYQAGYDPRRGAEVFRKFLELKGGSESSLDAWTSSHPLDSERIESILALSEKTDARLVGDAPVQGLRIQTAKFSELISRLREHQKVYDRHDAALASVDKAGGGKDAIMAATAELEACARALPGHAFFANTAGKAQLAVGNPAAARTWFQQASDLGQGLLEPELALGYIALDSNDFNEVVARADRGLAILPGNYLSLYQRGEGLLGQGRQADAQTAFQQVMQSAPQDSHEYAAAQQRLGGGAPAKKKKRGKRAS